MKKQLAVTAADMLNVCCLGSSSNSKTFQEQVHKTIQKNIVETEQKKKRDVVILVVSFGTSYNNNRDITIGAIEKAIVQAYPEYEVRRAFTSQIIIDILKERDGLKIDNVTEALNRAIQDNIKELIVQPTHLMNGYEYNDLAKELTKYLDKFKKIILAEPLLTNDSDFDAVVKAITEKTALYNNGKTAICFVGHGTKAKSNAVYAKLQDKLTKGGYKNYYIGTVEAAPALYDIVAALKANRNYKKVVLEPLMVVAGDHANNDIAGTQEDSWKSVLEKEGYEVECIVEGLGQIKAIWDIYIEHIQSALKANATFKGVKTTETSTKIIELKDGIYNIKVESNSSMFKIEKARLTIAGKEITAVITLSRTGYSKLYIGTAKQALTSDEADCIAFVEDKNGAYTYTFPVSALDQPIDCAAYSTKKKKWYDRQLIFLSASLSISTAEKEKTIK